MASTQIWSDTIRQEVCKAASCRRRIWFAVNVRTGNAMPFSSRPEATAVQPELETKREMWTVDLAQSHFVDCPARAQFRRKR